MCASSLAEFKVFFCLLHPQPRNTNPWHPTGIPVAWHFKVGGTGSFFFFAGWINTIQECSVSIREFITIKRSHYRMMLICVYIYIYCTLIDSDSVYIYVIFGSTSLGASNNAHVWRFRKNRKHPEVFFQLLSNCCLAGWYPSSSGGCIARVVQWMQGWRNSAVLHEVQAGKSQRQQLERQEKIMAF